MLLKNIIADAKNFARHPDDDKKVYVNDDESVIVELNTTYNTYEQSITIVIPGSVKYHKNSKTLAYNYDKTFVYNAKDTSEIDNKYLNMNFENVNSFVRF